MSTRSIVRLAHCGACDMSAVQIVLIAFFVLALVVSAVISYREITAGYYDGWKDDENE